MTRKPSLCTKDNRDVIDYTKTGVLTVIRDGFPYIRQALRLPKGIDLGIGAGCFKISDSKGMNLRPYAWKRDSVGFGPATEILFGVGSSENLPFTYEARFSSGSVDNLQKFVDKILLDSVYQEEFRGNSENLSFGRRSLQVMGPNRNGHYQLYCEHGLYLSIPGTSSITDNSSLIYNPETKLISPGLGWAEDTRLLTGTIEDGFISLMENAHPRVTYTRLRFNFENSDPNKSYSVFSKKP